jgi:hypothetical protein
MPSTPSMALPTGIKLTTEKLSLKSVVKAELFHFHATANIFV